MRAMNPRTDSTMDKRIHASEARMHYLCDNVFLELESNHACMVSINDVGHAWPLTSRRHLLLFIIYDIIHDTGMVLYFFSL